MLKKAYQYLEKVTPLSYDCGKLCNNACCKGEGEIWLLPDEQKLFEGVSGFEIIPFEGEYNLKCNTDCHDNRGIRPYCCRIFPYFPIVKKIDGRLSVKLIIDPRGTSFCPLSRGQATCTREFARAVRKSARLLCQEQKYYEFFKTQGELLEEILQLRQKLM